MRLWLHHCSADASGMWPPSAVWQRGRQGVAVGFAIGFEANSARALFFAGIGLNLDQWNPAVFLGPQIHYWDGGIQLSWEHVAGIEVESTTVCITSLFVFGA